MKRWREGRRDKEKGGGMHTGMKDKGRECVCVACVCIHMWVSRILMRAATTPSNIPVLFFKGRRGNNGEEGPVTLAPNIIQQPQPV